jgi:HEPN domain-containing protein
MDAYRDDNYPYAVRLSQECVELSLKAVLKGVAIEYPRIHDVSDIFPRLRNRFPSWFEEKIDYLRESSKLLLTKREPSLYGDEDLLIPPDSIMSEGDALDATNRAQTIYKLCEKLVSELDSD